MRNFKVAGHRERMRTRRKVGHVCLPACLRKTTLPGCQSKTAVITRFQRILLKTQSSSFLTLKLLLTSRDPPRVRRLCGRLPSTLHMEGRVPSLALTRSGLGRCRILVSSYSVNLLPFLQVHSGSLTPSMHRFTQKARQTLCSSCSHP